MRDFALYSSMASVPKRSAQDLDLLPGVCLQKWKEFFHHFSSVICAIKILHLKIE